MKKNVRINQFWRYFNPINIVKELLSGWTLPEMILF